jgi:hypothetical protein
MLQFGEIIEVSESAVRVRDLETGSETDWLVVMYPITGTNRVHWPPPAVGSRVGYIEQGETGGCVLGAFYDSANAATGSDDSVTVELFGFTITITSAGVEAGDTGTEPATKGNALKTLLENFITALKAHTHAGVTTGAGISAVPDAAAIAAFETFSAGLPSTLASKVKVE